MHKARCYRTLDRPITVFGLEIEDLLLLLAVSGALLFAAGPFVGVGAAFGGYALLRRFKSGRPPGYVYERLYRFGIVEALPFLAVPHLVPIRSRYSAVADDRLEKFYWRRA
jgi:hypothetical protein